MTVALSRLKPQTEPYDRLERWATDEARAGSLSTEFAALLWLIPHLGPEDHARIARFFGGGKLNATVVKSWLREHGAAKLFDIKPTREAERTRQRLRFAPRLLSSVGLAGWCILLDEVELIGRYSPLQRGRSYAELARWLGRDEMDGLPGITTVAAFTDDFVAAMFDQKRDEERDPPGVGTEGARALKPSWRSGAWRNCDECAAFALRRPTSPRCAPPRAVSPISIMTPTSGVRPASRSASAWWESRCANTLSLGSPSGILSASTENDRRSRLSRSQPITREARSCNRPPPRRGRRVGLGWRTAGEASNEAFGLDWPNPLFGYQKEGIERLLSSRSVLLADEMGLGKTIQAIAALRILAARREIKRALIVCPVGLIAQWRRQIRIWAADLPVSTAVGARDQRKAAWRANATLYLSNFEVRPRRSLGAVRGRPPLMGRCRP